jgi:predicted AAA+ superfamily ATPase
MIFYRRQLESTVTAMLQPGKVVVILGARRVGKTMLVQQMLRERQHEAIVLNGEDFEAAQLLSSRSIEHYRRLLGSKKLLVVDEAQKIPEVGSIAKLMIDHIPDLKILLTGSSSFDLFQKLGEPLTGRKTTLLMYPLSLEEFMEKQDLVQVRALLPDRMIFGCYPEVWQYASGAERIRYLKELASDYLLKDILQYCCALSLFKSGKRFLLMNWAGNWV